MRSSRHLIAAAAPFKISHIMGLSNFSSQLATAALIGTRRGARLPEVPSADGAEWSRLLARVAAGEGDAAGRLLDVAACVVALHRAGAKPGAGIAPALAVVVEPAPPEDAAAREVPAELMKLIEDMWKSVDIMRLVPLFDAIAKRGLLWPPAGLPMLMNKATATSELRPLAIRLGGRRMGWLATMEPAWAWAAGTPAVTPSNDGPDAVWKTGTLTARLQWFTALRQARPAEARALIEGEEFRREPAPTRARMVEVLAAGLEAADAPLLDGLLQSDRSGEVREAARLLLLRLPGSQMGARMAARARAWARVSPTGLDFAPAPIPGDEHAQRDGLPAPPKGGITTEHLQAWLETVVGATPLTVWQEMMDEADAAALIPRFQKVASTWRKVAMNGLVHAANHQQNRAWLAALLDDWGLRVNHVELKLPNDLIVEHLTVLCQRALEGKGSLRALLNALEQHDGERPPEVCRLVHRVICESAVTSKAKAEELTLLKMELMKITPNELYDELLAGLEVGAASLSLTAGFERCRELKLKLREAFRMLDALPGAPAPARGR